MGCRFVLKLADIPIAVSCMFESTYDYCRDYATDEGSCLSVEVSPDDLRKEREREADPSGWSDNYIETLALYRIIAEELLDKQVLLFHGSAVSVDGEAYIFTGPSGAGKSTHSGLWERYFAASNNHGFLMINDDKPLIRFLPDEIRVYGNPWNGKHRRGANSSAPLRAIGLIDAEEYNSVTPLDPLETWKVLMQQTYRPGDSEKMAMTMEMQGRLFKEIPFYRICCNMETEVAAIAYGAMSND